MISKADFKRYASSPQAFRDDLFLDVPDGPEFFETIMDDWQRKDFEALDPALKCAARGAKHDGPMRAYLERPRGHSKTTDLAVLCVWALAFANRALRGYAFAADRDQAALLKDAMHSLIKWNPWLLQILDVQKHSVVNIAKGHAGVGSELHIATSDVGSSYGILPDLIVADELVHWCGEDALWTSLLSSAAKRKNCLLVVITNAGFTDSWQWQVREAARAEPGWYFSRLEGPHASWMSGERLEEQRRMLPAVAFNRLWMNQWSSGGGDALTEADINAAFDGSLRPLSGAEKDYLFVGGVDLGLTRDCSALCVLGVRKYGTPGQGRIRLAHARLWKPTLGKKINLTEVESELLECHQRFRLKCIAYDPWQAELLSQRLATYGGMPMQEVPLMGSTLQALAARTIESFTDRRLQLYEYEPLRRDLLKLRVEERSYGYRLVSPRDNTGHGDSASAFTLALMVAHELAGKRPMTAGSYNFVDYEDEKVRARRMWLYGFHPEEQTRINIVGSE